MKTSKIFLVVALVLVSAVPTMSQQTQETVQSEQPTAEAAGEDSKKEVVRERQSWDELIAEWMTPKPYPKAAIVRIDEKYAYPHVAVGYKLEIVREEGDTVWMRGLPPENPESLYHKPWLQRQAIILQNEARRKAYSRPGAVYFLDFTDEPDTPETVDRLRFERPATALPSTGRWQMGFDVADMNGDGHVDLIFPPQRKAIPPRPAVFLGDGKGGFTFWTGAQWPENLRLDYGGVAVNDFDGDDNMDIALACHFQAQYVLYGDGKGDFRRSEILPSPDPRISSRAVTSGDFDRDGRADLAFLAEIDYDRQHTAQIENAKTVWVLYGGDDGWALMADNLPTNVIGDVISSGDFNDDGQLDIAMASNSVDWRYLVMFNRGGREWGPSHYHGVLSAAYHFGVAPAGDELFAAFTHFRVMDGKNEARTGLIKYAVTQGDDEWVAGQPVFVDAGRENPYFRVSAGDLDGDGRADLVAGRKGGGLEIWLQEASGKFVLESGPEFDAVGRIFDVHLADLNGDGLHDVIAAGTAVNDQPGGVYVWLTSPVE